MRNGTLYLNNNGSRWIVLENGEKVSATFETKSGEKVTRKVQYFESFGNFATLAIYYKGKLKKVFADTILDD